MQMQSSVLGLGRQIFSWKSLVYAAVGLLLLGWLLVTPAGLLGKLDAISYAVCHRIAVRSFHLGERQLPLCARCMGMYLGAMLGLIYQTYTAKRRTGVPPRSVLLICGLLVIAFGVDGVNSYLHFFPGAPSLYEPDNTLRLLTGTGMGLVLAIAVFPAFNQTMWSTYDGRPAIDSLRSLVWLGLLASGLDLAVLTQNPILLYLLALLSVLGVMVLLTMIYSMLILMVTQFENRYQSIAQLSLPLVSGFGVALIQIVLLDGLRFLATGTWDGFHFG